MKTFKLLFSVGITVIFFSNQANAFPSVGDKAVYSSPTGSDILTTTSEIIEVNASGGFTELDSTVINGQSTTRTNIHDANFVQTINLFMHSADSDSSCQHIVSSATDGSTAILEIKTVAGTSMPVCHIHFSEPQSDGSHDVGDLWFGNVPFGLVESSDISPNGTTSLLALTSFVMH